MECTPWEEILTTELRLLDRAVIVVALGALVIAAVPANATEVWSGRNYGFSKAPFANPTLAVNQDRITDHVWITRGNIQGIYNIEQESAFTHNLSPVDTEWAFGDAVNHASLTFQDWEDWASGNPMATIGLNACVHLISDDIYLDIVFDEFSGGSTSGGSFAYRRALPPVTPTHADTWGRIKSLYR